jgi:hypothetical protein
MKTIVTPAEAILARALWKMGTRPDTIEFAVVDGRLSKAQKAGVLAWMKQYEVYLSI